MHTTTLLVLAAAFFAGCVPPSSYGGEAATYGPSAAARREEEANRRWSIDTLRNSRAQLVAMQPMATDPKLAESIRLQIVAIDQQLRSLGAQ